MKTKMTEMFGIDVPIFAFTHCRDVVAEVCQSGGLGVLGGVAHTPTPLEIDLDGFVSHKLSLDDVNRGFELMEAQDGIRSVIEFD